jgi:hypothetical protein
MAGTGYIWDVSDDEYFADAGNSVSNSELKDYRTDPDLYYQRHITKSIPPLKKDNLTFGSGTHAWFLIPEMFDSLVVEIPEEVLAKNGAKSTKAYREFADEHPSKMLLKEKEILQIKAMGRAAMNDPTIASLLTDDGITEQPIKWVDSITGLTCRCKTDRLLGRATVDLKTYSGNPRDMWAVARHIESMGYHNQAAFYQDGVTEFTDEVRPFVFIFIGKEPPYPTATITLSQDWIDAGREKNRSSLNSLSESRKLKNFLPSTHGQIVCLERPGFAAFRDEWELN